MSEEGSDSSLENEESSRDEESNTTSNLSAASSSHSEESTSVAAESAEKTPSPPATGKLQLVGYRNKLTGVEYRHAKVQTVPAPWKYNNERFEREVQTAAIKNAVQQTAKDNWTQVQVKGIYLPTIEEKILEPSEAYISADEIIERRLEATITLQKYWRVWLAKKELDRLKAEALRKVLWDKEQEWFLQKEESDWFDQLRERRLNPRTKDDFLLLFGDLKKWWHDRKSYIEMRKSGAEMKAEMCTVLDEEIQNLEGIEALRQRAHAMNVSDSRHKFLEETGRPKKWKAYKGDILVETAETLKGRSLHQLYVTLCMTDLTVEKRVDALMTLKETIKPYEFALTRNLASLANREIDLLLRGTKMKLLHGLQLRIRNLFWQFARQPAFNPEALRLSKLKTADGSLPKIFTCSACNQYYIQSAKEAAESGSVLQQRFAKCENCQYVENEGWNRKDFEIYKRMLKLLRASEEKRKTRSGIIYLLQPNEICFMVEKIWQSQSALSGISVLKDLEFVRWNVAENWTPWNCVLLTRREATMHYRLKDPRQQYEDSFFQSVLKKHISAQGYFSTIPRYFPYLSGTIQRQAQEDDSSEQVLS